MQRRGKHTPVTIEELLGNGVFPSGRPEAIYRGSLAAVQEYTRIRGSNLAVVYITTVRVTKLTL
jgi:hypothetical protein